MKKKHAEEHENHERWLVSYADFITLLFAFFVVMFASSQVNKKKVASIAVAFESYIKDGKAPQKGTQVDEGRTGSMEGPNPNSSSTLEEISRRELAPVKAVLEQELVGEIEQGKISLALEPRGLVVSLRESAAFPSGRDTFNREALPVLEKIAQALRKLAGHPVRLEGHTDNMPIQTAQFPSNWELSAARATAVLTLLERNFEIKPERLAAAGYSDFHPIASNDTLEGRAHNRRVDIVVLSRSAARMEPRQQQEAKQSN